MHQEYKEGGGRRGAHRGGRGVHRGFKKGVKSNHKGCKMGTKAAKRVKGNSKGRKRYTIANGLRVQKGDKKGCRAISQLPTLRSHEDYKLFLGINALEYILYRD